jgi:hypothetical protein
VLDTAIRTNLERGNVLIIGILGAKILLSKILSGASITVEFLGRTLLDLLNGDSKVSFGISTSCQVA